MEQAGRGGIEGSTSRTVEGTREPMYRRLGEMSPLWTCPNREVVFRVRVVRDVRAKLCTRHPGYLAKKLKRMESEPVC